MIDLHLHSTISDGSDSPDRIVELAHQAGCAAIALTDHDSQEGVPLASKRGEELGVVVVPGCEISCAWNPGVMHVLCYYVQPETEPLHQELEQLRADREERNHRIVTRLIQLGLPITYEEVQEEARRTQPDNKGTMVGKPHFAAVLVRKGVVSSLAEAFDLYLAKGRAAYVPKARLSIKDVIALTRSSGGVTSLAHPLSLGIGFNELENTVRELAAEGLVGLEAMYPTYSPGERQLLIEIAHRTGLVPTGGSDYHGSYKEGIKICSGTGDLVVPDEVLNNLANRISG